LKISGATSLSLAAALLLDDLIRAGVVSARATVVLADAQGVVISDPHICVGCRRCELACTEYNLGKAQPSIANVKVYRNMNFGTSMDAGEGMFGNFKIRQETCKQCRNPVPCASACPVGAIVADPDTGAREVTTSVCVGCKACQAACPYHMTSFDEETQTSQKCNLCDGSPQCVANCPTGALKFVAWQAPDVPADSVVPPVSPGTSSGSDRGGGGCYIDTLTRG
jgi:Fe-S-cluster-containing dehydrogenase component